DIVREATDEVKPSVSGPSLERNIFPRNVLVITQEPRSYIFGYDPRCPALPDRAARLGLDRPGRERRLVNEWRDADGHRLECALAAGEPYGSGRRRLSQQGNESSVCHQPTRSGDILGLPGGESEGRILFKQVLDVDLVRPAVLQVKAPAALL